MPIWWRVARYHFEPIWPLSQRYGYHSRLPIRLFRRQSTRRNQTPSMDGDNAHQRDVELQSCSVRSERRAALNRSGRQEIVLPVTD